MTAQRVRGDTETLAKHNADLPQMSQHNGSYVIFIFWLVAPCSNVVQTFARVFAI